MNKILLGIGLFAAAIYANAADSVYGWTQSLNAQNPPGDVLLNTWLGETWATTPPPAPPHGVHWTPGQGPLPNVQAKGGLNFGGGPVLDQMTVTAVFWGLDWPKSYNEPIIQGLDSWYQGINGSVFANTIDEYLPSGANGNSIAYNGYRLVHKEDSWHTPQSSLSLVCDGIRSGDLPVDKSGGGYYPIYTDSSRTGWFCAYHSAGLCTYKGSQVRVQFSYYFYPNVNRPLPPIGDTGCQADPKNNDTLAALADESGQQLTNARTDPTGTSWRDAAGDDAAEKCLFTSFIPVITLTNGTSWEQHGTWSNAAYASGTGYPNSLGELGCISGN